MLNPPELAPTSYFIGWDVGAWHCDGNRNSQDAIVFLDASADIVGKPWRGNLRETINRASDGQQWLAELMVLCQISQPLSRINAVIAIDTPLGFPKAFIQLVTKGETEKSTGGYARTNRYLFRETEQFLFEHGHKPMSAIQDLLGSQSTKGIHAVASFTPVIKECGVWTDGQNLTAIEAYPGPCKKSELIKSLLSNPNYNDSNVVRKTQDEEDALICALTSYLFVNQREKLKSPPDSVKWAEGWIWVPQDTLRHESNIDFLDKVQHAPLPRVSIY